MSLLFHFYPFHLPHQSLIHNNFLFPRASLPLSFVTALYAICQYDGLSTLQFLAKKKKKPLQIQDNSQFVGEEIEEENSLGPSEIPSERWRR